MAYEATKGPRAAQRKSFGHLKKSSARAWNKGTRSRDVIGLLLVL